MLETLEEHDGRFRNAFLFIHPVDPGKPESILSEENYRRFSSLKRRVTDLIS